MYHRFHSFAAFLRSLTELDLAHFYRPLSNRTIPSIFYPVWGLDPYGYHVVVFVLFFLTSWMLFQLVKRLTGRSLIGFLAAFYFSIHSINVYSTFDFAFTPDVLYGLFYMCAVCFFVEAERRHSRRWALASGGSFLLSLMSKEAALTLPAVLVFAHVMVLRPSALTIQAIPAYAGDLLRKMWLHIAVFIVYLTLIAGYLGVIRGSGGHMLMLSRNVPDNLITAFYWAFNLERDG